MSHKVTPVVCVEIEGPLVQKFMGWVCCGGPRTACRSGGSGPDFYIGFHNIDDAERIEQWLEYQSGVLQRQKDLEDSFAASLRGLADGEDA